MGITKNHYGQPLHGQDIWVEDRSIVLPDSEIKIGPRIGVESAGVDALHPWRYWVAGSRFVSAKRT
jgi:DNA-3-methyladenine glycosylase